MSTQPLVALPSTAAASSDSAAETSAGASRSDPPRDVTAKKSLEALPPSSSVSSPLGNTTSVAAAGQAAPEGKTESIGRGSKRSFTGQKRDASRASKRSAQPAPSNEKPPPGSEGATNPATKPRPKKKGGFLAFLNCCSSGDESPDDARPEAAHPAHAAKGHQTAATQPLPNANSHGASADDAWKEKATQSSPHAGDAAVDKRTPTDDASHAESNHQAHPRENGKLPVMPAEPVTGLPVLNTTATTDEQTSPQVRVQAPTPVVNSPSETAVILDRTPEQAQRDHDIEMTDAGPSLPLSEDDATHVVADEEKQAHDRGETVDSHRQDLPPPPPLPPSHDGSTVGTRETSTASTPEPPAKWLLPPLRQELQGRKCLVLDLDETLVHSSFKVSPGSICCTPLPGHH